MRRLTGKAMRAFRRSVAKALGRPTSTVQLYGTKARWERGAGVWTDYSLRAGALEMQRSGSGVRPREFAEFMRGYSVDYWQATWRIAGGES